MIYRNTQPSFHMTSSWACHTVTVNGRYEYSIVYGPTEGAATLTFPVELPVGATVKRAWLSMQLGSPLSGAAYKRVNGISIPSSGEVDVEGIDAETQEFNAIFSFKANGIVYEDYYTHDASLAIAEPTLNIEYAAAGTTDEDDPDNGQTIIGRPMDTGVQLPRLLDADFHEVARIDPTKVKLTLKLRPLSTAVMNVPPENPAVKVKAFFELFTPHGSAGIFRATEVETRHVYRAGQTVYLEHAFGTLADSLALGTQAMSAPVATVIATLLESQNVQHWVLGDCEVPEDYELIYEYSYDNLLQAFIKIIDMLPAEYAPEFDTTKHPFVVHIRRMPDDDSCECRLNRNLTTVQMTIDSSDLCTRVYPFGAGEGTDRMTLTNLIGSQHMDSPNAAVWGYVSRTFTSENIFDALTLRDVAQRYLDRHDHPTISVVLDAFDLSEATGEAFDRFPLGRVCRLALPDYGVTMRERVIVTEWPDVYGNPEAINVTLANRIRDASDEIADLIREATDSKLLGGSVATDEETSHAGEITPVSPFEQSFEITGYGNVLSVKTTYRCVTSEGEEVGCGILVDGEPVEDSGDTNTVEILRSLAKDENGVPLVGTHKVLLLPETLNTTVSEVTNTITIKSIEKR